MPIRLFFLVCLHLQLLYFLFLCYSGHLTPEIDGVMDLSVPVLILFWSDSGTMTSQPTTPVLERTIQLTSEAKKARSSLLWGCLNSAVFSILLVDMLVSQLCVRTVFPKP